jgi:hypothetical protein
MQSANPLQRNNDMARSDFDLPVASDYHSELAILRNAVNQHIGSLPA